MIEENVLNSEWLCANQYGSFAMGCVDRIPRRKYHSLLTVREPVPGEPLNAVMDVGEYIESEGTLYMLHSFNFGDRTEPQGFHHLQKFTPRPFPKWLYQIGGLKIERTVRLDEQKDVAYVQYQFKNVKKPIKVHLRPYVLFRPMHGLKTANPFLNGGVQNGEHSVLGFQFYKDVPPFEMRLSGIPSQFVESGQWVEGLRYQWEEERGYPHMEDTYAPGDFVVTVKKDCEFVLEMGVDLAPKKLGEFKKRTNPGTLLNKLKWAGEQYLIETKQGFHSIIAGYPWFGHWGRDSLISLRGLCLEAGNYQKAEQILFSYGEKILESLHRGGIVYAFPDSGLVMTGIDSPLLFVRAVQLLEPHADGDSFQTLMEMSCRILNALRFGADKRVHVSAEGLLFVEPGPWATTWMDVMQHGQPVTPRAGFAVEINALFYNDLHFVMSWAKKNDAEFYKEWADLVPRMQAQFQKLFWSEELGYLADSHNGQDADFSLRPNQLWAIALPFAPLTKTQGKRLLKAVDQALVTPVGLRTLAPQDPKYRGRYQGGHDERDQAYHQGTVWPWLIGVYADALEKNHGIALMQKKMKPILESLQQHMDNEGCLGHINEVFDGDEPHRPGGAPAQAWSVAEFLRVAARVKL